MLPTPAWDARWMSVARTIAEFSKDPSTKVGAVIVSRDNKVIGTGYNGFPRGVVDSPQRLNDRDTKYSYVVHADLNAILNASAPHLLPGSTMYLWPILCCNECAKAIIQAGIKRVVHPLGHQHPEQRMRLKYDYTIQMFREANVQISPISMGDHE